MSSHSHSSSGGNAGQGGLDNIRHVAQQIVLGFTAVVVAFVFFFVWQPWKILFPSYEDRYANNGTFYNPSPNYVAAPQPQRVIQTAPQPILAAPHGCRGPEPDMHLTSVPVMFPNGARFSFDVAEGTVTLQARDGRTIDLRKGEQRSLPDNFPVGRVWSERGATLINVTFYC